MLSKRMEVAQIFEAFQETIENGLGRAKLLSLVADALREDDPEVARALAALAGDMTEDRTRALGWMERLIDAARQGEVTGSVEF